MAEPGEPLRLIITGVGFNDLVNMGTMNEEVKPEGLYNGKYFTFTFATPENIEDGVNINGVVGTLEEKQDITDYLKNIPNTYYLLNFIEDEGLYGATNDSNSPIYLFDANGTIIKTISNNYIDRPLFVGKNNILWVNFRNSLYNIRETNKMELKFLFLLLIHQIKLLVHHVIQKIYRKFI